ncbi:hypothetical protein DBV15_04781 [Temnothorax longispinosus]|uniref:Uncharacterized protein n=1 Tax=Temnothorax longispinosus TaxID=300112 RepID=A0A4S2JQP0_9HYME|nr:hypothetical protein DBV15_04781 [Temnothorax longispinosus]
MSQALQVPRVTLQMQNAKVKIHLICLFNHLYKLHQKKQAHLMRRREMPRAFNRRPATRDMWGLHPLKPLSLNTALGGGGLVELGSSVKITVRNS